MAAILNFLTLTPKAKIGAIDIEASLEEVLTDQLQLTEHPVEKGAAITDHSFKRPAEVVITCGWSNSSIAGLLGSAKAIASSFFEGGSVSAASYIDGIYSQLLALQESRVPFDITTHRRQYTNMLITGIQVTTDQKTSSILMVQVTCRQIIIVSTQTTTMPPASQQANPASTAAVTNKGVNAPVSGSPSPGGAYPPSIW